MSVDKANLTLPLCFIINPQYQKLSQQLYRELYLFFFIKLKSKKLSISSIDFNKQGISVGTLIIQPAL